LKAAKETVEVNPKEPEALLVRKREALVEEDYQKLNCQKLKWGRSVWKQIPEALRTVDQYSSLNFTGSHSLSENFGPGSKVEWVLAIESRPPATA
jgi:hypothetical protein